MASLLTNAIASTPSVQDIKPTLALIVPIATTDNSNLSTDVSISGLGRLFAAASTLQSQLAAIRPGTTTSGTGTNFGTDVASFAAEAQNFVDAFNQAQAAISGLQNVTQASQFATSLDNLAQSTFANGGSGTNSLAQLGINFQNATTAGGSSTLGIDMRSLELAFNADPTAAFSLLTEAVNAFSKLAAGTQTGQDTTGTSAFLTQIIALQASLGLFNGGTSTAPLGLAALLALEPSQGANNLNQQIAALSQFALVSSLLG